MNFSKFIVSYKYLDKSFSKKQILWALDYLIKIANKHKIDISLNEKNISLQKNYIFLLNSEKILNSSFKIKSKIPKKKGSICNSSI